jgi:thiamine-phosphate pyrophosphorylase
MQFPLSPLYAIVDDDAARAARWTVPDLARAFMAGGARLLQVRAKSVPSGALLEMCENVVAEARARGVTVVVNDRADIARLSGAAGVHVGQDDLPVAAVRSVLGGHLVVGLSTHSRAQVDAALTEDIDYLAVGPVFGTTSKAGADPAVGLELVRYAEAACAGRGTVGAERARPGHARRDRMPIVAIGGITLERARDVIDAGAASVAVISDLLNGGNPERRVREYLARLA